MPWVSERGTESLEVKDGKDLSQSRSSEGNGPHRKLSGGGLGEAARRGVGSYFKVFCWCNQTDGAIH